MPIQIDLYTLERTSERGATQAEIEDVLQTGVAVSAKHGWLAKAKVYSFRSQHNGKSYEQKRVEVIYTVEGDLMITVTVYVFYGKWE